MGRHQKYFLSIPVKKYFLSISVKKYFLSIPWINIFVSAHGPWTMDYGHYGPSTLWTHEMLRVIYYCHHIDDIVNSVIYTIVNSQYTYVIVMTYTTSKNQNRSIYTEFSIALKWTVICIFSLWKSRVNTSVTPLLSLYIVTLNTCLRSIINEKYSWWHIDYSTGYTSCKNRVR